MIIDVLEIKPDGTQVIVQQDVPEPDVHDPEPSIENYLLDLDYRISLIELGVN